MTSGNATDRDDSQPEKKAGSAFWGRYRAALALLVFCCLFTAGWQISRVALEDNSRAMIRIAVGLVLLAALSLWVGRRISVLPEPRRLWWQWLALFLSSALSGFVLWRIPRLDAGGDFGLVFWSWASSFVLYAFAVSRQPFRLTSDSVLTRRSWLALAALGLFALLLRTWQLGCIPFTLGGDEASQAFEALRFLKGELRNPFGTGWMGLPNLSFLYGSIFIPFLGPTVTAVRLPWALAGTAAVLANFFLVRRLWGSSVAWTSVVFLATYHYHIHFSRVCSNNIADTLFMSLSLLFLSRGLQSRLRSDWILAGAFAGWSFYLYYGARLTPVVLGLVLVYRFLWRRTAPWPSWRPDLLTAAGAFCVTALPMVQHAIRFPNEFNTRVNQVGILQSGWLEREITARGGSIATILWDQFERAALAFNFFPDRTVWYGLPEPLLNPFFGCLFLLGLLYGTIGLVRWDTGKRVAPLVFWWWSGMILGGVLTESPPSNARLITLSVPACFFLALGAFEVARLAKEAWCRFPVRPFLVVVTLLFVTYSLKTYFWDFTPRRLYGGRNAEMATQIAPTLNTFKDDYRFYFVGAPWMYWGFATLPFLVPEAEATDVLHPLGEVGIEFPEPDGKGMLFIVLPTRIAEVAVLQRLFPDGVREDVHSPVDGRLMVTLFRCHARPAPGLSTDP